MVLFLDQQPLLKELIEKNEFLVDYEYNDMYCFFKGYIEGLERIVAHHNNCCPTSSMIFIESTNSFEYSLVLYFGIDKDYEFLNEIYYNALELIQDFYNEIYDQSIYLIQSAYSEGIILIDQEEFDELEDFEKDSI